MGTVGERIEKVRKDLGMSMTSFANIIGVSNSGIINNWEKGRAEPSIKHLCAIAEAGNKTLDWLLRGEISYTGNAGEEIQITEHILFLYDDNEKLKKENEKLKRDLGSILSAAQKVEGLGYSKVADNHEKYSDDKRMSEQTE